MDDINHLTARHFCYEQRQKIFSSKFGAREGCIANRQDRVTIAAQNFVPRSGSKKCNAARNAIRLSKTLIITSRQKIKMIVSSVAKTT